MTPVLDDVQRIRAVDPQNMYNRIFDFPEQMADALTIGQNWKVSAADFSDIKNIVVIGMGGSAIGGDMVRSYLASKLQIPFMIVRNYDLPEFVDDETLVIASSYSGNTEETLSALDEALRRKSLIAAITTGGMMQEVAKLNDIPTAILPGGMQPRAALGYSFVPLLMFFEKIGLVKGAAKEIQNVIASMKIWREKYIEDSPVGSNPAKDLAAKLHGRMPIIYSGPTLTDTIGVRWKGQICENSKNLSFANQFAEFNHNELVGWAQTIEPYRDYLATVILHDSDDHPQVNKRMQIVKRIISELGVPVHDVHPLGTTTLERMFSLIQMGDFVSYYLAVLNEVDPTPVKVIERLKGELSGK